MREAAVGAAAVMGRLLRRAGSSREARSRARRHGSFTSFITSCITSYITSYETLPPRIGGAGGQGRERPGVVSDPAAPT
ncbi:hypothetical protein AAW14_33455 [Streptomyces hygroscopicus]|nr:hypothetical protein [Streptomyces hygroscopicus]